MKRETTDRWQDRLSEYVDGDLTAEEDRACTAHLAICEACATIVEDLRRVVETARALPAHGPERDLWPAIESAIAAPEAEVTPVHTRRRVLQPVARPARWWSTFAWPQLAAAGLAVSALAAVLLWSGRQRFEPRPDTVPVAMSESTQIGDDVARELQEAEASVAELRKALAIGGGGLDSSTVRVLEQNLELIEKSMAESRVALAADPRNPYLREHLEENIQGKLRMLRRATLIASVR